MATSFASEAVGLRANHQRASVVRYAEFSEFHCKLHGAVRALHSQSAGGPGLEFGELHCKLGGKLIRCESDPILHAE